jgi:hypothetical protein
VVKSASAVPVLLVRVATVAVRKARRVPPASSLLASVVELAVAVALLLRKVVSMSPPGLPRVFMGAASVV